MSQFVAGIVYVITAIFFLGLLGCAFVILLSWIDIFSEGFRDDPEPHADKQQ